MPVNLDSIGHVEYIAWRKMHGGGKEFAVMFPNNAKVNNRQLTAVYDGDIGKCWELIKQNAKVIEEFGIIL
tara:strand:+ start:192 stop:404 length:213 start_codon:yes stop_codon:yes gene_type:complete